MYLKSINTFLRAYSGLSAKTISHWSSDFITWEWVIIKVWGVGCPRQGRVRRASEPIALINEHCNQCTTMLNADYTDI